MTSPDSLVRPASGQLSQSVSKSCDARVDRSRSSIAQALVILLARRPYDKIRVSDVTRKAGVGRATFYAHFDSKDDLLRREIERIVAPMLVVRPSTPCLLDCTALFEHVQHAAALYRSLMAAPTRAVTERIMQDAIQAHLAAPLAARLAQDPARRSVPAFLPRFVAATILTLIAWSLDQPAVESPARLQQAFSDLVAGALAC